MSFVHDEPDFAQLLVIVAREVGVDVALVEKDYWVTHCLWALERSGLEVWFKGGTSLSKGYGLIVRFSEDLDLMIQHGSFQGLPEVSHWTSTNKGPCAQRRAFYQGLAQQLLIPSVVLGLDEARLDKHARGADYIGRYPGAWLQGLAATMSPFVRFEVGRARVVPFVPMALGSFVHDWLSKQGSWPGYTDNRPRALRCVHPWVTLLEKLDAMARRYDRELMEPDSFVRHYEDAAHIIGAADRLPPIPMVVTELAADMLAQRDIAALPNADEPALLLDDPARRAGLERAWGAISPMFWGSRISLARSCDIIRAWIEQTFGREPALAHGRASSARAIDDTN